MRVRNDMRVTPGRMRSCVCTCSVRGLAHTRFDTYAPTLQHPQGWLELTVWHKIVVSCASLATQDCVVRSRGWQVGGGARDA